MHDAQPTRAASVEHRPVMRKPQKVSGIHFKKAANKGFIGTHHYDNNNTGESYRSPEDHAYGTAQEAVSAFSKWATGEDTPSAQTTGGQKAAPSAAAGKAASRKHGRGVD